MLTFDDFQKNISFLLYFKGVKEDKDKTRFFYNLLKNDFENEEFSKACSFICKEKDLFGKYPDPKLFYDWKKQNEPEVLIEEGIFFLDNTMPEYAEHLDGCSDEEATAIWKWIFKNKQGQEVSTDWIISVIKKFRAQKEEKVQLPNYSDVVKMIEKHKEEK